MATEPVLQSLESADESLRHAIAQLIEMRFGVPQCRGALHEAAEKLRSAVSRAVPGPEINQPELKQMVRRMRAHMVRVQALLDAAAAFYCGWVSAAPPGPPSYAPDGQLLRDEGGGRLMLNA
jgi:hypothetical protein